MSVSDRDRPGVDEDLVKWLRGIIAEKGFRVVVIDDLSAVRMTFDGTRETLKLMRELKRLKDELDVSILVIAGSREQRKGEVISEVHMQRSRVLCDEAIVKTPYGTLRGLINETSRSFFVRTDFICETDFFHNGPRSQTLCP